jgi:uncharacterized protein (TIGR02118 family)
VIVLCFSLHRLPHLTRKEFQRYWREVHAPLVSRNAQALGIHRYLQVHAVETPVNQALRESRQAPEGYDGMAEVWWESLEVLAAKLAEPAAQQAARELLEDERRFIDLERSPLWIGEKHVVLQGARPLR